MTGSMTPGSGTGATDSWTRALERSADHGRLAPSVHNTQPWTFVLHADRMELRADRTRQLTVLDPSGRELVQSVGAALLNVRASLAAQGFAVTVDRLPPSDDRDLLAVVRPTDGEPDAALAALDRVVHARHTNRRPFEPATVPEDELDRLSTVAAKEDTLLMHVRTPDQRQLVAGLTQEADRLQNADPAYRAELQHWTNRSPAEGDGVAADAVPLTSGARTDEVPVRDFDNRGAGALPSRTGSGLNQTLVLLATAEDDPRSWLRSGEALERLLLELTRHDWVAGPLTQSLEVSSTRARLTALTAPAHAQMLLRLGRARPTGPAGRRPRRTVVENSTRPAPPPPPAQREPRHSSEPVHRPVPDGRGGTTWL
jgi:hypothetical protein